MKTHPVSSDQRFTVTLEHCGESSPRYILRFCGEWVDKFRFYSSAAIRAVGESSRRRGALIVTEIKSS